MRSSPKKGKEITISEHPINTSQHQTNQTNRGKDKKNAALTGDIPYINLVFRYNQLPTHFSLEAGSFFNLLLLRLTSIR